MFTLTAGRRLCSKAYVLTREVLLAILDLFYPPHCPQCQLIVSKREVFCGPCDRQVRPVVSRRISLTPSRDMVLFAASSYEGPIKTLIHAKFRQDIHASRQLARMIVQLTSLEALEIDYLVPIPLHYTRYAKRGYNQARVMSQELSVLLGVPMLDCLKRARKTAFQSTLEVSRREENVRSVFAFKAGMGEKLKGARIMLVDDLSTTGATLRSAGKVLLTAKPQSLMAAVGARAHL